MRVLVVLGVLALVPARALAQATIDMATEVDAGSPAADAGAPDAGPVITPPTLLQDSPAPYPPEAAKRGASGEVSLQITLDETGEVSRAALVQGVDPALDQSALQAAMGLRFSPVLVNGVPAPATLGYVYHFTPPPPPPPEAPGRLEGELRLRGRNSRPEGATVTLHRRGDPEDHVENTLTDRDGNFAISLPPGDYDLIITGAGLDRFLKSERLHAGERLRVQYWVNRPQGPYETVVTGQRERVEVSRTDLRGDELRSVPGTMGGDPFRAVLTLPGVAEAVSGVAYPIVRGAAPASTGWYLDGVRLPNLFHFFLLSAVVHPEFISGIDFYPSAYPAEFGRFTGGIISAHTANGRTDRVHGEVNVDLINSGGFLEVPLKLGDEKLSLAAGGRFSYLGAALHVVQSLGIIDPGGYGDYWDYQTRAEWQPSFTKGTLRLLVFGSHDEIGTTGNDSSPTDARSTFHRADLRWRGPLGTLDTEAGLTLGIDELGDPNSVKATTRMLAPRFTAAWKSGVLTLRGGADAELKHIDITQAPDKGIDEHQKSDPYSGLIGTVEGSFAGAWLEARVQLGKVLLVPGLRSDLFWTTTPASSQARFVTLEPRLAVRYSVTDATTLKIGGGLYHQSPTAYIDLPTVDLVALSLGLQESANAVAGFEHRFEKLGLDLDASVYWSEKLSLRELEIDDPDKIQREVDEARNGTVPPSRSSSDSFSDPFRERNGRSVGFEVLLRRKIGERLFGWIAYTYSRTTRHSPDSSRRYLEIFDQTHILNLVASYDLGSGWRAGLGFHLNSGKPYDPEHLETEPVSNDSYRTPSNATNCTSNNPGTQTCWVYDDPRSKRLPLFFRVDARIEKSWTFDRFTLTGYLDVLNATLQKEVLARDYTFDENNQPVVKDSSIPLVVPMLGLRADF